MQNKTTRGRIRYLSHDGGTATEFGREWFAITWHADGQRTLQAQSEIEAGVIAPREVLREVTYTMDSQHRPLDCFNRLHQDGKFLGAGWMRFVDGFAYCEVDNVKLGRISQRLPMTTPALSLGVHPVSCDMFHLPRFDRDSPERIQRHRDVWMTSLEHDGCSGPLLTKIDIDIEYVGRERVTVPAGSFETDHYRFNVAGAFPREHPVEDLWCIPNDFTFVKITVGGYMNASFELVELSGEGPSGEPR